MTSRTGISFKDDQVSRLSIMKVNDEQWEIMEGMAKGK